MSTGKEQLIEYLLENGKDLSWVKLADKFNLKQGFTNNQKSDHARQIWERYCKRKHTLF
jgi:L-rhamnose isomerase